MTQEKIENKTIKGCFKVAYVKFYKEFKNLLKPTWIVVLTLCFANGLLFSLLPHILRIVNTSHNANAIYAITAVLVLFILFFMSFFTISVHKFCNDYSFKANVIKWANLFVFKQTKNMIMLAIIVLTAFALVLVIEKQGLKLSFGVVSVLTAGFILFLAYVFMIEILMEHIKNKYVFGQNTKLWKTLKTNYKIAMKHYSFLWGLKIVKPLLNGMFFILLNMPTIVLGLALYKAYVSAKIMGDVVVFPTHFYILAFISGSITMLCLLCQKTCIIFTNEQVYDRIEKIEQKRNTNLTT